MVAFSTDTDYVLCASQEEEETGCGSIYRLSASGDAVCKFGHQTLDQPITTVDWTNSSNACLLGSTDGSVKVTSLIKV